MKPVDFLKYFKEHNYLSAINGILNAPQGEKIHLKGLIGSAKALFATILFEEINSNMVVLLNDREEAAYFYDDLNNLGLVNKTLFFPSSFKRYLQYGQADQVTCSACETLNKICDENTHLLSFLTRSPGRKSNLRPNLGRIL